MALELTSLSHVADVGFDTIIDVRSPSEFAEDRIPGAINLPVLSNDQRAEVGTIYVQDSPFRARKIGGALVARNAADHVAGPLAGKDGAWRPLVYCWRGGQRSGFFTDFLRQIGWRAEVIKGGYQSYRKLVHAALYLDPLPYKFILLDGNTGTAKTAILEHLKGLEIQTIDLEGLANHRGSLLGGMPGGQPAQKGFESALVEALFRCDTDRPVVVEAESSKIGDIAIPTQIWAAMKMAPRIEISAPGPARARFLAGVYAEPLADTEGFLELVQPLRKHRGHAVIEGWEELLRGGQKEAFVQALIAQHYDPSYNRSRGKIAHEILGKFRSETLDEAGQMALAGQIAELLHRRS